MTTAWRWQARLFVLSAAWEGDAYYISSKAIVTTGCRFNGRPIIPYIYGFPFNPLTYIEQDVMDYTLFEATPGMRVVFLPDSPRFTIVTASQDMCRFIGMAKEQFVGQSIFDAFPANPADPDFTGHKNLSASLAYVLEHKKSIKWNASTMTWR
jgi:hypothetical protein